MMKNDKTNENKAGPALSLALCLNASGPARGALSVVAQAEPRRDRHEQDVDSSAQSPRDSSGDNDGHEQSLFPTKPD